MTGCFLPSENGPFAGQFLCPSPLLPDSPESDFCVVVDRFSIALFLDLEQTDYARI